MVNIRAKFTDQWIFVQIMNGWCVRILNHLKGQAERMPTFTCIPATEWQADVRGYWQEPDLRVPKTELYDLLVLQARS